MKARSNLYQDEFGNSIAGRYIYRLKNGGKYSANLKYPEGYTKSGIFYSFEDAVEWVENNWEKYRPGWYMDNGVVVTLRRPGEYREPRMF
jgi:uncharacterized protein YbdZ (MbtH family)